MRQDYCGIPEENSKDCNFVSELSIVSDCDKLNKCSQFVSSLKQSNSLRETEHKRTESISDVSTINTTTTYKNPNYVQLYRPIYIARRSKNPNEKLFYDEGDEFEFLNKIDDDYLHVLHLRTNTECTINRTYLRLDPTTPLRLANNDRGVIQRCLFQYNIPGAYLIRRSKNELNSFVLSISQIFNQRNAKDWHYLIRINPQNHQFYFAQESKLANLSFTSFQKLIQNEQVQMYIPLSKILPFYIEFEEDLWHISRRYLTLEYRIGKGEFGEVWRGLWINGNRTIPVAIKKLHRLCKNSSTEKNFIHEIETLKTLRNNYIVTLYGIAKDFQTNETLLITELMENGDLKYWLQLSNELPSEKQIISFALDICRGMSFLEQKSLVHRDLACRNLLLTAGGYTVKIADFGLSTIVTKDDFIQRKEAYLDRLPIRWTAPELFYDQTIYSIKSDVWSFGIVLIEIWLKGTDPYPDEKDFSSIRRLVKHGYVHKKPLRCSNQFYNRFILPCLSFYPSQRPDFKYLIKLFHHWNKEKLEYDRLNNLDIEFSL